mgnify:CR=1 FL=1
MYTRVITYLVPAQQNEKKIKIVETKWLALFPRSQDKRQKSSLLGKCNCLTTRRDGRMTTVILLAWVTSWRIWSWCKPTNLHCMVLSIIRLRTVCLSTWRRTNQNSTWEGMGKYNSISHTSTPRAAQQWKKQTIQSTSWVAFCCLLFDCYLCIIGMNRRGLNSKPWCLRFVYELSAKHVRIGNLNFE